MTEYITISSIGVSKESQFRAAKIIEVVCNGSQNVVGSVKSENFFEYGRKILSKRWQKLRETIQNSEYLILPKYPQEHCLFSGKLAETLSGTYMLCSIYMKMQHIIYSIQAFFPILLEKKIHTKYYFHIKNCIKLIKTFCEFFIWEFIFSLFNCIL